MKSMRVVIAVVLVVACMFMITGCGGSSDSKTGEQGNKIYGVDEEFQLKDMKLTPKKIIRDGSGCQVAFKANGATPENQSEFYFQAGEGDDAVGCNSTELKFTIGGDGNGSMLLCFGFDSIDADSLPDVGTVSFGTADSNEAAQVDLTSLPVE